MHQEPHAEPDKEHVTFSIKEVAARAGVTEHAVRKALREGRLKRCNPVSERALFSKAECERFVALHERGAAKAKTLTLGESSNAAMQLAKVEGVTGLLGQSQQHTENAWTETRLILQACRQHYDKLLDSKDVDLERMRARIEQLESIADEYRAAVDLLRKNRYDQTIANAEAAKIRTQGEAAIEVGKVVVPALFARVLGGEQMNQGAFRAFVDSLRSEQRDKIFESLGPLLDPAQSTALMTLFSAWEAKSTKEQDTERPPPMNGTGTDG
jgi:hypothetical protein